MLGELLPAWWPHTVSILMGLVWIGSVILIHRCVKRPRLPGYLESTRKQILAKTAVTFSRIARILLWLISAEAAMALAQAAKSTPDMKSLFCNRDFHEALTIFSLSLGLAYGFRTYKRLACRHAFTQRARFGGLAMGYVLLVALAYGTLHISAHGGFA